MSINVNSGGSAGGVSFGSGPSATEKSDLGNRLGDKDMAPWKQQEIVKELLKRLEDMLKQDHHMSHQDKQDLENLLKDLKGKGAHGNDAGDKVSQLLQALGVPQDVADQAGQMLAGGGGQGGGQDDGDIR
jgi:hypothetical protein